MSILSDLNEVLEPLHIPIETGVFSGVPPDEYLVFIPLTDMFESAADNRPGFDVQEVRISLFSRKLPAAEKADYNGFTECRYCCD